jgi:dimethylargininase
MRVALTRQVSPALALCELSFIERAPIDFSLAQEQHREYAWSLGALGLNVISLPTDVKLPDCVFVEDPAIVLDEIAVICRPGVESRRPECDALAEALGPYRELHRIIEPGTLEGGDVMLVDGTLYVGMSRRTNAEGIRQLTSIVRRFGYKVCAVPVSGSLHLKSACCWLGDRLLVNREWIGPLDLPSIDVAEPHAANVLRVDDTLLMPASFPRTRETLEKEGYRVITVDISELQKAEGGVTCSSLIFRA